VDDFLRQWLNGLPSRKSWRLKRPVSVTGRREKHWSDRSEYASISITIDPAEHFEVVDRVPCRSEIEALRIGWPQPIIFGLLDVLMTMESYPLYKVRVTLNDAAYHDTDSTEIAFREAARDAGRRIVERIGEDSLTLD
jgi:hypothetical protein